MFNNEEKRLVVDLRVYEIIRDSLVNEEDSETLIELYDHCLDRIKQYNSGLNSRFLEFIYDNQPMYILKCFSVKDNKQYPVNVIIQLNRSLDAPIPNMPIYTITEVDDYKKILSITNGGDIERFIEISSLNIRIDTYTGKPITEGFTNDCGEFYFEYEEHLKRYLSENYGDDYEVREDGYYYIDDNECVAYWTEFECVYEYEQEETDDTKK